MRDKSQKEYRSINLELITIILVVLSTIFLIIGANWQLFMKWNYSNSTLLSPGFESEYYPVPLWFVISLIPVALYMIVVIHEVLHILPAFFFRNHIHELSIGTGERLLKAKIGKLRISIRKRYGGYIKISKIKSAINDIIVSMLPNITEIIFFIFLFVYISERSFYTNGFIANPTIIALWLSYTLIFVLLLLNRVMPSDYQHTIFVIKNFFWMNTFYKNQEIINKIYYYRNQKKFKKSLEYLYRLDGVEVKHIELSLLELEMIYEIGLPDRLSELYNSRTFRRKKQFVYTNDYCWFAGLLYLKMGIGLISDLINLSKTTMNDKPIISEAYNGTLAFLLIINSEYEESLKYLRNAKNINTGELLHRFFEWIVLVKLDRLSIAENRKLAIYEILLEDEMKNYSFWEPLYLVAKHCSIDLTNDFPELTLYSEEFKTFSVSNSSENT